MASLKRFELPTHGLEGRCSILLSYRLIALDAQRLFESFFTVMERVMGMPHFCMQHIPLNRKPF